MDNMIETLQNQITRIEEALYGNGNPKNGIVASVVRIEATLETAAALGLNTEEKLDRLTDAVTHLTTSVDEHHKKPHLDELVKKKGFWTGIVFGFIVLHFIATYAPNIWDIVVKMVGLPGLVIPPL